MGKRALLAVAIVALLAIGITESFRVGPERPWVTPGEAGRIVDANIRDNGRARAALDPGLLARVETGPLKTIDRAKFAALHSSGKSQLQRAGHDYHVKVYVPRQRVRPAQFLARISYDPPDPFVEVGLFVRQDGRWKISAVSRLLAGSDPDIALDRRGYASVLSAPETTSLKLDPDRLGTELAEYLNGATQGRPPERSLFGGDGGMRQVVDKIDKTSAELRAGHTTGAYSFASQRYRAASYRTRGGGSFSVAVLVETETVTPDGDRRIDTITFPAGADRLPVFPGGTFLQVAVTDVYTFFVDIPPSRSPSPLSVVASNSETTAISARREGGGTSTWP